MLASCSIQSTHLLESLDQLYERKNVTLSNGVANLQWNAPLRVRVANFLYRALYLHKNEKLGTAISAPTDIMTIEAESPASDTNKASPGRPEDKGGAGLGAVSILIEDDRKTDKAEYGLDDVEISHLSKPMQKKFRYVL